MSGETEIGGPGEAFRPTAWRVVTRAKHLDSPERREALIKLIQTFWKPLYGYLRRQGKGSDESRALLQAFFGAILARDYLVHVEHGRGRFRTFLLHALQHYQSTALDPVPHPTFALDVEAAEREFAARGPAGSPEEAYTRDWAVDVLAQALDAWKVSCECSGASDEYDAFKAHVGTSSADDAAMDAMAQRLGVPPSDIPARLRAARARFHEAILVVVRAYSESEEETREEFWELLSAL